MDRDKVKQLVSAAIDLSPDQRDAFVRREAGNDESLLNEALSLLDAASNVEANRFLASDLQLRGPAVTEAPQNSVGTAALAGDAPEQFGRYRVLECIGEGGMGIVYRAEQRSPIRREVVIKVIKLGMDTKLVIARFEAERQALAMMDHPHIAKVYDAGTDAKGRPYFVMEYVKGTPIVDYCDRNHLSLDERLELFPQVCQAIQHAHQKGIIHRDIKPSNILVSTQDGRPFAKVIDFGIAKATNQRLTDRTLFTEHVNMIGTPAYMSPEQADGNIDIDTRTDVYSLGVVLYELLTGNTPFDARRLKSVAINEIARIIREEDPPKPSTRLSTLNTRPVVAEVKSPSQVPQAQTGNTLASLAKSRSATGDAYIKSLRGEVDWIVMKALEKDRARRYETPNAIADDIDRFLNGLAIVAAPPSWGYRAIKFSRKYKAPLAAGAMLTVLLLLGLAGTAIGLVQARMSLSREKMATARESVAREDALMQAYIANISAAQVAMQGESWPEARQRLESCPVESRGWEWQFLSNIASAPDFGFAEPFTACVLSSDGRLLLCQNGLQARVIDLATKRQIWNARFKESQLILNPDLPSEVVYKLPDARAAIARDGTVAITTDNQIAILNPAGDLRTKFKININSYYDRSVSFSPAGKFLLYWQPNKVMVYDAATGNLLRTLENTRLAQIDFSVQDELMAVALPSEVIVYGSHVASVFKTFRSQDSTFNCCCFSPDNETLAAGMVNSRIQLYPLSEHPAARAISCTSNLVIKGITFSPDSRFILATDTAESCQVIDVATGQLRASLDKPCSDNAFFSSDGSRVLDSANNMIWNWKRDDQQIETPAGKSSVVGFTPSGDVAVSLDNYRVRIWNTQRPSMRPLMSDSDFDAKSDGIRFVSMGGRELFLHEWSAPIADAVVALLKKPAGTASDDGVAVSPDGHWNASLSGDNKIAVRDNTQGKVIANLISHEGRVRALAFTPDGSRLVTGGDDCTIRFWDPRTWREVAISRNSVSPTSLLFTGDGSRLVIAFSDKGVQSWDLRPYELRKKDQDALLVEQRRVKPYVDNLIAGNVAWDSLAMTILGDGSLSDAGKCAALSELHDELGNARDKAATQLEELQSSWVTKSGVLVGAQKLQLSRAVRKALEQQIEDWSPKPKDVLTSIQSISRRTDLTAEQYVDAVNAAREIAANQPENHSAQNAYGVVLYRSGDFDTAIKVLQQAELLRNPKPNKPVTPGHSVSVKPLQGDIDNDESIIAMAQFKSGHRGQARATLKKLMLDWGRSGDRVLMGEAAGLIDASTTQPMVIEHSPELKAVTDAIYSSDLGEVNHRRGQAVRIKGHVVEAVLTRDQTALNLVMDYRGDGMLVWISANVLARLPAGFAADVLDSDIVLSGTLQETNSISARWKGRTELELTDASTLQVLPHSDFYLHPLVKRVASQSLTVLDPTNRDSMKNMLNADALVRGRILQASSPNGAKSIFIDFEHGINNFQLYITAAAMNDFMHRYNIESLDNITGREVMGSGTITDYHGKLEIVITDVDNIDLLSTSMTTTKP